MFSLFCFSLCFFIYICFFFFKQKTAYEMRISDWSSDVCSSDLHPRRDVRDLLPGGLRGHRDPRRLEDILAVHEERRLAVERLPVDPEIGRASCRERVCQYV